MKHKEILVFGATGQIGRNLIRKLTENNYKIIAVTRNIHRKGYILKTQANPGYLELVEVKNFEEKKLQDLFERCSICINLIGILFEKKKDQFDTIHHLLPQMLSKLAHKNKIEKFIHFSALNVENINDSDYATSKSNGEKKVLENFSNSTEELRKKASAMIKVIDEHETREKQMSRSVERMEKFKNNNE